MGDNLNGPCLRLSWNGGKNQSVPEDFEHRAFGADQDIGRRHEPLSDDAERRAGRTVSRVEVQQLGLGGMKGLFNGRSENRGNCEQEETDRLAGRHGLN